MIASQNDDHYAAAYVSPHAITYILLICWQIQSLKQQLRKCPFCIGIGGWITDPDQITSTNARVQKYAITA